MHVIYRNKTWEFDEGMTVIQLLKYLKLLPESVLVVRNGKLVAEDQHLSTADEVKIVAVVSGG
ncbi:MAG: MoaD/ThiS family protein [Anaerolineae bacterium]|nr:MoaD/ThiS family protein [Anaerolineae bacterium]